MQKNNWFSFLILLLVSLQPVISFGNVSSLSSEIVNTQEEVALFKTKSSKTLVFQEINITSVEHVVNAASVNKNIFSGSFDSITINAASGDTNYLIDFRGILTTQIFPFHFFL
tara:strand:- start:289718 stop:290056 length:339 start_codon:yes stop_codon:yes gene_type:complete